MTLLFIITSTLTISLSLIITTNPLGIGLLILIIALLVASLYAASISSWLAFLIFLIYIGGILVIFAYFLALTPNIPISYLSSWGVSSLTFLLLTISLSPSSFSWRMPLKSSPKLIEIIFNPHNFSLLILLTLILFFSIVIIVKISQSNKGPLRAFISYV